MIPVMPLQEAQRLRVVIVLPVPLSVEPDDDEVAEVERSRILRIALLEAGYNVVATLPGDRFLPERLGEIQPDLIVVDAEARAKAAAFPRYLRSAPSAAAAREALQASGFAVDYVEDHHGRRLGAVRLERVRLIDNVAL